MAPRHSTIGVGSNEAYKQKALGGAFAITHLALSVNTSGRLGNGPKVTYKMWMCAFESQYLLTVRIGPVYAKSVWLAPQFVCKDMRM